MADCRERIISEEYVDFLWKFGNDLEELRRLYPGICIQPIGAIYAVLYVNKAFVQNNSEWAFPYGALPALYALQQTENLEASNILRLQEQPILQLKGQGVLLGFLDTGIDYRNLCFLDVEGKTRILEIWDQTEQSGRSPEGIGYGSVYTQEQIQQALQEENPLLSVPSMDQNGHGTKLASIAAGSYMEEEGWIGAAPSSKLAVVKLKPAKQYLKQYYAVDPNADAYQENDIMLGLRYLNDLAAREGMPLVVCFALGSNMGGHNGTSPLGGYLNLIGSLPGRCVVVAGGNEANQGHHYYGKLSTGSYQDVEIRIAEQEYGVMMEVWASMPDVLSISMRSPTGEEIPRIDYESGSQRFGFLFEETVVYVEFQALEVNSGEQLVVIRMFRPTAGLWRLRVYGEDVVSGSFHVWLPVTGFLTGETEFLNSDPDTTLTEPGNSEGPITIGAYQVEDGSIAISSGRGFTRENRIKPDLAAPGVAVPAFSVENRYSELSGTCAAAALTAGGAALLMEWAVVKGNRQYIDTQEFKQLFIRGASRDSGENYPNRIWGYGKLNLYKSFEVLGRFDA